MRSLGDHALSVLPGTGFLLALLLALEAVVRAGLVNKSFIPAPSAVAVRVAEIVASGQVVAPLLATVVLLAAGYGIGCLAAVALGMLMGNYRRLYLLFEPLTELLRPVPKPALLPALILFLGLGASMKVTIVASAAFFPVLINTVQGVRTVDPVMTNMARTFGHSGFAVLWRILLPASAPYILGGMRISLGVSLVVVIIAEMISGEGGLGDMILNAQRTFLVVDSYAWLVIVGALGFALNAFFLWAERRATFWIAPSAE